MGQWSSARSSVLKFHAAGHSDWTLTHAFFADMGGILVDPLETDMPSFPLNAEQLFILVDAKHIDYPNLEQDDIKDRSKSDGLARLIAIAQGLWFFVNCMVRFAQGIFVTTLELTTISFILVFLVTSYSWYHKPMDVNRPITLKLNTPLDEIRSAYGQAPGSKWYITPLDFLTRDEWFLSRFWKYYTQILHHMHIPLFTRPKRRPYDFVPSHDIKNMDIRAEVICGPIILLFSAMFLIAWNFHFPTPTEQLLWRIASVNTLVYGLFGGALAGYIHKTMFRKELEATKRQRMTEKTRKPHGFGRLAAKLRNIDPEQDPDLEIPIRVLFPISALCVLYSLSRGFILVEDIIGLRNLPESAFQTISWSTYIPHW
ncbi:hypothetical protein N7490_009412 [Penicillium lividum]|nr:hypothetical protein N7490_009412 [Penicillium lividum]